jgi:hypothetical protein
VENPHGVELIYKIYGVSTKKIIRSRNVIFAEEPQSSNKPDVATTSTSSINAVNRPLMRRISY